MTAQLHESQSEPAAFATDERDRVVYWNRAAEISLDIPAADAVGRRVSELFLDDYGVKPISTLRIPGSRPGTFTRVHLLQTISSGLHAVLPMAAEAETGAHLTPRETEILRHVAAGLQNKEIARELQIRHATVRNHVQNLLRKLEVHSKLEAVALAFRSGWLASPETASAFAAAAAH